ncbi:unnamed protein product, partial [Pelagomonas calceolata]
CFLYLCWNARLRVDGAVVAGLLGGRGPPPFDVFGGDDDGVGGARRRGRRCPERGLERGQRLDARQRLPVDDPRRVGLDGGGGALGRLRLGAARVALVGGHARPRGLAEELPLLVAEAAPVGPVEDGAALGQGRRHAQRVGGRRLQDGRRLVRRRLLGGRRLSQARQHLEVVERPHAGEEAPVRRRPGRVGADLGRLAEARRGAEAPGVALYVRDGGRRLLAEHAALLVAVAAPVRSVELEPLGVQRLDHAQLALARRRGHLGRRPALGQRDRRDGVGFERCEGHGRGGEALRGTPPRRGFQRRRGERYESYDGSAHFCA